MVKVRDEKARNGVRKKPHGIVTAHERADAALSALQHLADQERILASRLLPVDDPMEAIFRPPEALPHSYLPAQRTHGKDKIRRLKIPRALPGAEEEEEPRGLLKAAREAAAGQAFKYDGGKVRKRPMTSPSGPLAIISAPEAHASYFVCSLYVSLCGR
jgi:hypothetical protein